MSSFCRGPVLRIASLAITLGVILLTLLWLQDPGDGARDWDTAVAADSSSWHATDPEVAPSPGKAPQDAGDGKGGEGMQPPPIPPASDGSVELTGPSHSPLDNSGSQEGSAPVTCPSYSSYSKRPHEPLSEGKFALGYQRPPPACRTFNSSAAEAEIARVKPLIADPDLARIFENTFPNTLDTAIKWQGVAANNTEEELCFVITGDIDAMWLRDSANQLQAYRTLVHSRDDDLAAVLRGAINLQARYIVLAPYCNAFQAPPEAGGTRAMGSSGSTVSPPIDKSVVSTCNFELDSFAAFLQLSSDYLAATGDLAFFGRFQWVYAVQSLLHTARAMTAPTYDEDGKRLPPPYTYNSRTTTMTATLNNVGTGNPVAYTGMVRSPFRPSDDAAVFEFLVPANMMFSRYLNDTAGIMGDLGEDALAAEMREMATGIRDGIEEHAVVEGPDGKKMYAYEVDGFGGRNLMDDANIPSLLSAPFIGYLDAAAGHEVYANTRGFVLSGRNPWYCRGPAISGVGSPHIKPGHAWPMASIVQAMTTDDDAEIEGVLGELVSSTAGLGLMHESVNSYDATDWTREWFSWANGLFGQMILDLEKRKPHILGKSFQSYGPAEDLPA